MSPPHRIVGGYRPGGALWATMRTRVRCARADESRPRRRRGFTGSSQRVRRLPARRMAAVVAAPCTPEEDPVPRAQTRATLLAFVAAVRAADAFERHLAADATFTARATGQVIRGRAAVAAF